MTAQITKQSSTPPIRIAVFLFDGMTALDAIGPYDSLGRIARTEIMFVGRERGLCRTGDRFLALQADVGIAELSQTDILIVPGGHPRGIAAIAADQDVLSWLRKIDGLTRFTCSVCTDAIILGAAGILSGRKVATHWRAQGALSRYTMQYSSDRVLIDDKYITSAGVSAGIDMGLTLCALLTDRQTAEAIELSMHYDPKPPFGTGNPEHAATPERIHLIENILRH